MKEKNLLLLLKDSLIHNKEKIALKFKEKEITYQELDEMSDLIASYILKKYQDESIVAIAMKKGIEQIVSIIGILKAGKTYLPIDLSYPNERIKYILDNSNVKAILSTELAKEKIEKITQSGNITIYENIKKGEYVKSQYIPKYAYAMYTSGSTGKPKGNLIKMEAASNLINWQIKQSNKFQEKLCITLQLAPISFDVSFQEIFSTLCIGGKLIIVDEEMRIDFKQILNIIYKEKVTRVFMPPVYLNEIANIKSEKNNNLKEIIVAGEQLKITEKIKEFFRKNKNCTLVNQYGPTETHVVTSYTLDRNIDDWKTFPPIGKEISNVKIYILDENLHEVEEMQWGELYISGICITGSYMNNSEETKRRYIKYNGTTIYKTGDICRRSRDGNIEYSSRADDQIKIRGFRVELQEIEKTVLKNKEIKDCAVVAVNSKFNTKVLKCFISLKEKAINEKNYIRSLKQDLIKELPEYMIPKEIRILDKLPLNPNGKIDKKYLKELENLSEENQKIKNDDITQIFKSILELDEVDENKNFFELGGNSILANRLIAEVNDKYDLDLPVVSLYQNPTINKFIKSLNINEVTQEDNNDNENSTSEDIAIIGIACKFPNAENQFELWNNIKNKNNNGTKNEPLNNIDTFDTELFNISVKEAKLMDPQIRKFLECVWEMFEDAGYNPFKKAMNVGVFAGSGINSYLLNNLNKQIDNDVNMISSMKNMQILYNNDKDFIATKTSYAFNLLGPSINVQSACSTSLVAIHLACQSLKNNECDYAIAGASVIMLPNNKDYKYSEDMVFSKDGNCKAFDENASGTVFSNGIGCILLKPLSKAKRDNDNIYAVIKGSAINNDGNNKVGFSAPSVEGQTRVIKRALKNSGKKPEDIEYIETHGTGTKVGDAIEITALKNAYKTDKKNYCAIGSIKNDIGHSGWASGMASIIKVAMALKNKKIPPMNNFESINKSIKLENSPFYINNKLKEWKQDKFPRSAAISAFGLGGTNAHIILEEYKDDTIEKENKKETNLLTISANTKQSVEKMIEKYKIFLENTDNINLKNMSYTLNTGRKNLSYRTAIIFDSKENLQNKLNSNVKIINKDRKKGKNIFLFSGNGTQYVNMGMNLYKNNKIFKQYFDKCEERYKEITGKSILEIITNEEKIEDIENNQIAIFSIEYALYNFWIEIGIIPDILIGHSLGEYTIACVTGIFSIEDTIKILIERGKILKKLGNELGMISVRTKAEELDKILKKEKIQLDIAAINTKELVVLSGEKDEINRLSDILNNKNIQNDILNVSTAGHTKKLEKYVPMFRKMLEDIKINKPNKEIISTVTGKIGAKQLQDKEYWCKHLVETVKFSEALKNLKDEKENIVIEIGASPTLLGLAMEELPNNNNLWIVSLKKEKEDLQQIYFSLSQIYLNNIDINFEKMYNNCKRVSLPTYEFMKTKYWIEGKQQVNLNNIFYKKEKIRKAISDNLEENTNNDLIIIYDKKQGKYIEQIKKNSKVKLIEKDNFKSELNSINKDKQYKVILLLEHFDFINNNIIDTKKITKKTLELIEIINYLANIEIVNEFYFVDIQDDNTIQNIIIRKIYISLLQVAELENRNIKFYKILFNASQNIYSKILMETNNTNKDNIVLYNENGERYIYEIVSKKIKSNDKYNFDNSGIYIVTGGLGGIGKLITRWLAERKVGQIILLNRREPTDIEEDEIQKISEEYKCPIIIKNVNVAEKEKLELFIEQDLKHYQDKVKGIFHLAGVIDDATLNKINYEKMEKVLIPKFIGAWNLHLLSKKYFQNLEIFNLFSSAAAFIGNAGQVNHAIANSFLDSLAIIRSKEELPVNSINWGTWEKVGHLASTNNIMDKLNRKGFLGISPTVGITALECILKENIEQIAVLPMNWEKYIQYYGFEKNSLYKNVSNINEEKQANNKEETKEEIKIEDIPSYVKNTVEEIIGAHIDNDEISLIKLGLDSLSSIEIRNKIQIDLKIQLEPNFIYKNPNIKSIIEIINTRVQEKNENDKNTENKNLNPSFQERRWLKLIEKKYGERVIPIVYDYPFNEKCFIDSLKKVLERHISLRWYFPKSKIKEVKIDDIIKMNEPIIYNFKTLNEKEKIENISNIIRNMFDNMPSPYERISWTIKVIDMEKNKFAILLGVQHLDFDGSSVSTFSKEFKEFYCNMMFDEPINLNKDVVGYDEYIRWQNNYMNTDMKFDREYFKGLYGNGKITMLPNTDKKDFDFPRKAEKITISKKKDYIDKIDNIAQKINVSRFSIILASYARFISKLVNEDIITIATIINGRSNTKFKNTIGPFSAPFPLKLYTSKGITDRELIEQCNNEIIEINSRSSYPVSDLINIIPEYSTLPIETYFSDIGINYTNYKPKNEKKQNDKYRVIEILTKVEEKEFQVFNNITFKRVPGLHLVINELKDSLAFNFYYHSERYDKNVIENCITQFFDTLGEIITNENK